MMRERRIPIPFRVAFVLFSAVLISSHFVTGMFARYIVKAEDENVSRVASFGVEATADEASPVTILSNGTDENGVESYLVTVKNTGEVAVRYVATVEFTGDDADENADKFDNTDDQLTFTGMLQPGGEAQETVTMDMSAYFESSDKWDTYSNDDISGDSGEAPFTVTVRFTQVN